MARTDKSYKILVDTERQMEYIYGCTQRTGEQPNWRDVPERRRMKRWAIQLSRSCHRAYLAERWMHSRQESRGKQIERMKSALIICGVSEETINNWILEGFKLAEKEVILEQTANALGRIA